jgi:hypothetical protein
MAATVAEAVAQLSGDFEPRFRLGVQDRLRERMAPLLVKLGGLRPTAGAESMPSDVRADMRAIMLALSTTTATATTAGATAAAAATASAAASAAASRNAPAVALHPVAAPIDPKAFFKVVAAELGAARSDDAVLAIVVRGVTDEVESFARRAAELLKQLPVPELPKVGANATTLAQLFHMQLANAASVFALELHAIVAMLPATAGAGLASASGGGGADGGSAFDASAASPSQPSPSQSSSPAATAPLNGASATLTSVGETLTRFVASIARPYFAAATVVLLSAVDTFLGDYYDRGAARPPAAFAASVKARVVDFAARYAFVFDARAATVCARACLVLADRFLQRFVVRMLLRRGVVVGGGAAGDAMRRAVAEDCAAVQDAVFVLHPLDRLALRLGQLRCVRALGAATATSAAFGAAVDDLVRARFHPVVLLLAVVQTIPAAAAPSLATQLKLAAPQLVALIEGLLSAAAPGADQPPSGSAAITNGGGDGVAARAVSVAAAAGHVDPAPWDAARWLVLWEAANAVVGDAERGLAAAATPEEALCDAETVHRARRVVDALRM